MNTAANRANTIFFYGLTIWFFVIIGGYFTTLLRTTEPFVDIANPTILHYGKGSGKYFTPSFYGNYGIARSNSALLEFDLDADLTPLFNWSVKQLFLFVTIEYLNSNNHLQQVVIWDSIISNQDKLDGDIYMEQLRAKYHMFDMLGPITDIPLKITLHWEVTPISGLFSLHGGTKHFAKEFVISSQSGMAISN